MVIVLLITMVYIYFAVRRSTRSILVNGMHACVGINNDNCDYDESPRTS